MAGIVIGTADDVVVKRFDLYSEDSNQSMALSEFVNLDSASNKLARDLNLLTVKGEPGGRSPWLQSGFHRGDHQVRHQAGADAYRKVTSAWVALRNSNEVRSSPCPRWRRRVCIDK